MAGWPNLSDLISTGDRAAPVGLLGAPLAAGSVTPGRCDLAPALLRADFEADRPLRRRDRARTFNPVADRGDIELAGLTIEEATPLIRDALAASAEAHALTLLVGGNNAITRPALLGLGGRSSEIGLITLDAHFDMRDLMTA